MSGLRERLRRLQSVPQPDPSPIQNPAPGFSVAERLRRLDPLRHRAANPCTPCEQDVAAELGAEIVAPGVLLLERRHPLRRRHGRFRAADAPASMPALFPSPSTGAAGWAFIDTETSGLAGGTGTWAFVCGIGRFAGDDLLLRQWLLTRLDAEPVLLSLFADCLNGVDLLISYNGKSFDLPLLMTRFRLAGLHCPLEPLSHLDLLHPVRRAFATRWPNCRLASVEQRLLGVQRGDDLPGAEAPAAWLDWLRRGDAGRLAAVLRHNRLDLLSLAVLLPALAQVEHDPAAYHADLGTLARYRLRRGDAAGALTLLCKARPLLAPAERLLLAELYRRQDDWDRALALWEPLAQQGDPVALEALAKFYEHRSVDLRRALALVRQLPPGPARKRRTQRLCRKLRIERMQ